MQRQGLSRIEWANTAVAEPRGYNVSASCLSEDLGVENLISAPFTLLSPTHSHHRLISLMDPSGEIRNLFSRGSSPPGPQHPYGDQTFQPQQTKQHQHISPTGSLRGHVQSSSPSHVESLFSNLSASAGHRGGGGPFSGSQHNSAPATPVSSMAQSASPSASAPIAIPESRQSALLSLLSSVPSDVPSGPAPLPALQQIPTPPGSSQRSGYSNDNESQGRLLLEKLILG